jgi:acetolactate synthase-1/3 small subunit
MKQLRTFVAYTEDRPGVLNRVTSLFRRRAYNIQSLTVGRTHSPGVSRITLVVEASDDEARRIEANIYKLVDVLWVKDITHAPAVHRDLALIKVKAGPEVRAQVLELCTVFRASVVDVALEAMVVEITGATDKIDGFLDVLRPFGVAEMVRTGIVAMTRGAASAELELDEGEGEGERTSGAIVAA